MKKIENIKKMLDQVVDECGGEDGFAVVVALVPGDGKVPLMWISGCAFELAALNSYISTQTNIIINKSQSQEMGKQKS